MKSYTIEEKLKAVELAKRTSKANASKALKINRRRIQEWCGQELKLRRVLKPKKAKRLSGGGRNLNCEQVEMGVKEWIEEQRSKNIRVTRKAIQEKARQLFQEAPQAIKNNPSFVASDGWLFNFLRRNGFSLRKRTTIAQKQPDDIKTKVINYILYTDGLKANHAYPAASIAAADETAVWIDPIQNTTIEKTGAKVFQSSVVVTIKQNLRCFLQPKQTVQN